jgi:outer membrane receptor for ferrienterochelin and colicins
VKEMSLFLKIGCLGIVILEGHLWASSVKVYLPEVEIRTEEQFKTYRENEVDQFITRRRLTTYENLPEALSFEAEVVSTKTPVGTDIAIDGLGKDRNLWLLDGIPQVGRVNGALDTDLMPFFLIESIRISRHPGQLMGSEEALGGSVQMRSFEWGQAFKDHVSVAFRGSSHNYYRGNVLQSTPLWGKKAWLRVGFDAKHRTRYFLPDETEVTSDDDDLNTYLAVLQTHIKVNPRHTLVVAGMGGEKQENGILQSIENEADRWKLNGSLTWQSWWTDDLSSEHIFNVTQTRFKFLEAPDSVGVFQTNDETKELQIYGASKWTGTFWTNHGLDAGVDLNYFNLSGDRISGTKADTMTLGVFSGSNHSLANRKWEMRPAIRVSSDKNSQVLISPKWQNTYHFNKQWDVFWGGSVGYKRPSLNEQKFAFVSLARKYQVFGSENLEAETSYGGNAGTAYHLKKWVGRVGYDFKSIRNLITTSFTGTDTSGFSNFKYINVDKSIIHQAYSEIQLHPWTWVSQYVRYTFLWARNLTRDEPLPQSPVHAILAETKFEIDTFQSDIRFQFHWLDKAGFFDEDRSGFLELDEFMPSHLIANVFYTFHWSDKFSIFTNVKNIFDVTSRQFGWTPGFEIMLGVRYDSALGGS